MYYHVTQSSLVKPGGSRLIAMCMAGPLLSFANMLESVELFPQFRFLFLQFLLAAGVAIDKDIMDPKPMETPRSIDSDTRL